MARRPYFAQPHNTVLRSSNLGNTGLLHPTVFVATLTETHVPTSTQRCPRRGLAQVPDKFGGHTRVRSHHIDGQLGKLVYRTQTVTGDATEPPLKERTTKRAEQY
jgi:hypothetical protein